MNGTEADLRLRLRSLLGRQPRYRFLQARTRTPCSTLYDRGERTMQARGNRG